MRIHVLSDLHLEFGPFSMPKVEADVVVLAGDTQPGKRAVQWALKTFPHLPVIYGLGNHDYYAKVMPRLIPELKSLAEGTNVHLLENKSVVVGETVFWGATLWTDFELNRNPLRSAILAEEGISDYRKIFRDESENRIRAEDIRLLHQASLRCFRSHVATGRSTKSVVVTHHAPSRKSLPPDMEGGDARSLLRLGSRYAGRREPGQSLDPRTYYGARRWAQLLTWLPSFGPFTNPRFRIERNYQCHSGCPGLRCDRRTFKRRGSRWSWGEKSWATVVSLVARVRR